MSAINDQKQTRSQGWGKPCRRRYALVPVRCEQACRDGGPSGFRPLFDVLPVQLGGGFGRRHFSRNSSLRPGLLPSTRKGDGGFPTLKASVANPTHGGPSRGAHVAAPVSRLVQFHLQIGRHAVQSNLADLPKSHRSFSYAASSMDRTCSNRRPSNWVIQTIWSDRK